MKNKGLKKSDEKFPFTIIQLEEYVKALEEVVDEEQSYNRRSKIKREIREINIFINEKKHLEIWPVTT